MQPVIATCLSIALGRQVPDGRFFLAAVLIGGGLFVESFAAARRRRQRLAVTNRKYRSIGRIIDK